MKILWLSHFIPYPPKGGVLQRGYHLLKQTAKYHEVHLLAFNQIDLITPLFKNLESGVHEAQNHLQQFCKTVEFLPIPCDENSFKKKLLAFKSLFSRYPYTLNWLLSDRFEQRLKQILAETDFDFIHFDTISLAPFKHLCGTIPCSLDHHNIESHMLYRRAGKEGNILKKVYFYQEGKRLERYEKAFCPEFTFNFTCSEIDTQRLLEISPTSKAHTIPNGVDTEYFKPDPNYSKHNRLIFAGTLSWYPNIEAVNFIAKEIWPKIKKLFPNVRLDIIGANPPDNIVALAKHDPQFNVHGFVDDIRPLLNEAKCYVCPIKDGGGTKLKIVDALSMGMAIVADEIACEGINVSDKKNVLFASSPQQYITAIETIFNDAAIQHNLEHEARELAVKEYSYDIIGKQLAELFNQYSKTDNR